MEAKEINNKAGFKGAFHIGNKPAVLIIDFQKGFTRSNVSPLATDLHENVINNVNKVIHVANERNHPIFFTAVEYEENLQDAGIWIQKCQTLETLKIHTEAVKIDERFDYDSNNHTTIIKKFASAFFGTNLSSLLAGKGINTLLIMGTSTSGCVRASVVDAMQYGFIPVIIKDCVVDRTVSQHDSNLIDMESKYAEVMSSKDAITYLRELGSGAKITH